MTGKNRKSIVSYILVLTMLLSSFVTATPVQAIQKVKAQAGITVTKELEKTNIMFDTYEPTNNYVTLNYKVNFDDVKIDKNALITKPKEVVLVVDTSGSMGNSFDNATKISAVRNVLYKFLGELKDIDNVKLSIIDFNERAYTHKIGGGELVDVETNFAALNNTVKGLNARGFTNTGDGIRRAYEVLNNGSKADKYMILLADGVANTYSISNAYGLVQKGQGRIGGAIQSFANSSRNYTTKSVYAYKWKYDRKQDKWVRNIPTMYYGTGLADRVYCSYRKDAYGKADAMTYAKYYAKKLKDIGVASSFVSYAKSVSGKQNMQDLSKVAAGVAKNADTNLQLNDIYDGFVAKISDIGLTNVTITDTLPAELDVISVSDGAVYDATTHSISRTYDSIGYTYNKATGKYQAKEQSFSVKLAPTKEGTHKIRNSFMSYIDLDGVNRTTTQQNEVSLFVTKMPAVASGVLNILELQPSTSFELSARTLESKLRGYTVNLTKMTMSEFVGNINEVNGLYDIIYIGANGDYSNVEFDSQRLGKVNFASDITNRKAAEVVDYINANQLIVFDQGIFDLAGTKLVGNFSPLRNRENVKEISNVSNHQFYDRVLSWYNGTSHRPVLNITAQPTEYNGTQSSYATSHFMNFVYDATSPTDGVMKTELYLDFDGNGLFEEDEKVKTSNLSTTGTGYGIFYQLDDTFNGMMPWKVVLTDRASGAQDYQVGFSAYKGNKTVVNVLQLTPDTKWRNINLGTGLDGRVPLETPDYKINITYMKVEDFDNNYPNPVTYSNPRRTYPTKLNGNYDMIIFGFGDSYERKDLHSQDAIDAVDAFIKTGQSVMFTHDTAGTQFGANDRQGFKYNLALNMTYNFRDDMGFSDGRPYANNIGWRAWNTTSTYKLNKGLLTQYPYILADNPSKNLAISRTHDQYWKIDLELPNVVPWFSLNNGRLKYYPEAYYYTFTNGNITYSGTGHSKPTGIAEQEFFVNTMLRASRGANHAPTVTVNGIYDGMNVYTETKNINMSIVAHDEDIADQYVNAEIYVVVNGKEYLVATKSNVKVDEETNISFGKPSALTSSVASFAVKVVVKDRKDARGEARVALHHKKTPTVDITSDAKVGYLVNEVFTVRYVVDVAGDNTTSQIRQGFSNVKATVKSIPDYLEVVDIAGLTKVGSTYKVNRTLDMTGVHGDAFELKLKAKRPITKQEVQALTVETTYDVRLSSSSVLRNQKAMDIKKIQAKEGKIGVNINDGALKVPGATAILYDKNRKEITRLTTTYGVDVFDGKYVAGTYYVSVAVPSSYKTPVQTEQMLQLSYENHNPFAIFRTSEVVNPSINVSFDETKKYGVNEAFELPIYALVNGGSGDIVSILWKKVSDDLTATENDIIVSGSDFLGGGSSVKKATSGPYANIDTSVKKGVTFKVTSNGWYAIRGVNSDNVEVIKKFKVNVVAEQPTINVMYNDTKKYGENESFSVPVHLLIKGGAGDIVSTYWKKLGTLADTNVTVSNADFRKELASTYAKPTVDKSGTFSGTDTAREQRREFMATENGYYGVYTINSLGHTTVQLVKIDLVRPELISNVTITTPSPTYKAGGSTVPVNFLISGAEVSLGESMTAATFNVKNIQVSFRVPVRATVTTYPVGWSYTGGVMTGTIPTATVRRQGNGKYKIDDTTFSVGFDITKAADIVITEKSVTIDYTDDRGLDYKGGTYGNALRVVIMPNAPTLLEVNDGEWISAEEIKKVDFKGTADKDTAQKFILKITGKNKNFNTSKPASVANPEMVTVEIPLDESPNQDGSFDFAVDLTSVKESLSSGTWTFKIAAKDIDGQRSDDSEGKNQREGKVPSLT